MLGLGIGAPFTLTSLSALIGALFIQGEQGAWYDPSDLSTLFQDSAGTTPVTAMEQPVGRMLDKRLGLVRGPELVSNGTFNTDITGWSSIAGATLSWEAGRLKAVLGAAGGALQLENFTVGKVYEVTAKVQGPAAVAVSLGILNLAQTGFLAESSRTVRSTETVVRFVFTAQEAQSYIYLRGDGAGTFFLDDASVKLLDGNHATQATAANRPVLSSRVNLLLATDTPATQSVTTVATPYTLSFTGTGTVTLSGASTAGPLVGTGTSNRVSLTFTSTAATLTLTVTGDVRLGQLEQASTATRYQRVNTATDYDSVGFRNYLVFNGVNSAMATGSIDFTATNKMSIFAGAQSVDATARIVAELSASVGSNPGTFYLVSGTDAGFNGWDSLSRGDAASSTAQAAGVNATAPDTAVLAITHDISASLSTLRRNGVAATNGTGAKGLGNFGSYPLYIGARAGTGVFFNGRIYSLIVRGAVSSPSQIASAESYANSKTGAY